VNQTYARLVPLKIIYDRGTCSGSTTTSHPNRTPEHEGGHTMPARLSPRLAAIVNALPIQPHSRVLEIGCGPGAAARAVAARLTTGHILAIDRSATAIAQAEAAAVDEITSGRMSVRRVGAEDFVLQAHEEPYDIVFAVRVGALDGRHPQAGQRVLQRVAMATNADARLFIDSGDPIRELSIPRS